MVNLSQENIKKSFQKKTSPDSNVVAFPPGPAPTTITWKPSGGEGVHFEIRKVRKMCERCAEDEIEQDEEAEDEQDEEAGENEGSKQPPLHHQEIFSDRITNIIKSQYFSLESWHDGWQLNLLAGRVLFTCSG